MPTFGSLFAGIGGLDLGLERAGWTGRWQVERDPFCLRVLAKHWPDVARHGDIVALDPERLERVDLICGGFPCQPVSVAGKRLAQADHRWLWPEFSRIIRALRPRLVLVENVPGLLDGGIGEVLGDLAARGYDAEWECIPASAFGAPHQRDRVWLVAYADRWNAPGVRTPVLAYATTDGRGSGRLRGFDSGGARESKQSFLADADGERELQQEGAEPEERRRAGDGGVEDADGRASLAPWRGRGAPQTSRWWWTTEPGVDRVAHGIPHGLDRLAALGNAVVPQVAEWIGRRLMRCAQEELRREGEAR